MSQSFEFPGEYYEIIRQDFRDIDAETAFFDSYLPPGGSLLDVGCGTATNLRALQKIGHRCVGIDQSAAFINYAREVSSKDIRLIHTRTADYRSDEKFDLAFSVFVTMNYLKREELRPLLENVHHMLKPGGYFVVDIGHMLNFADNYQPYIVAHHKQGNILITRLIAHRVDPHQANWRHEETIIVRDADGVTRMYENFFDQMVLTAPEVTRYLQDAGFVVSDSFGSFRKTRPASSGRGHLILVAQRP
ncbi:class I SAM-dependent methyltransferase [Actinoplanes sp. NPDC049118]|uniref:class I SAM-dependent methyltransferase n=1 Tax=Actinoplanes sp. NPDC049118 TaxID=3155769 RepID=UPI00340A466C